MLCHLRGYGLGLGNEEKSEFVCLLEGVFFANRNHNIFVGAIFHQIIVVSGLFLVVLRRGGQDVNAPVSIVVIMDDMFVGWVADEVDTIKRSLVFYRSCVLCGKVIGDGFSTGMGVREEELAVTGSVGIGETDSILAVGDAGGTQGQLVGVSRGPPPWPPGRAG